jgi:hypothetical protein
MMGGDNRMPSNMSMGMPQNNPGYSMPMPGPSRRNTGDLLNDHLEHEYTVRGKLHWLGVMTDWNWEGTLYVLCDFQFPIVLPFFWCRQSYQYPLVCNLPFPSPLSSSLVSKCAFENSKKSKLDIHLTSQLQSAIHIYYHTRMFVLCDGCFWARR